MKPIKLLGLASLTAFTAMALAGVTSAMAGSTSLCKNDESPCSAVNKITHVHEATLFGAKATLLNSVFDIECDALFLGDTSGSLGSPLEINGLWTYSNCNNNCTIEDISVVGTTVLVLRTGHETSSVSGRSGLSEILVQCGFFIYCRFENFGLEGTGKGPLLSAETNGEVAISEQELNILWGFPCPETTFLDIRTTPLSATYIST